MSLNTSSINWSNLDEDKMTYILFIRSVVTYIWTFNPAALNIIIRFFTAENCFVLDFLLSRRVLLPQLVYWSTYSFSILTNRISPPGKIHFHKIIGFFFKLNRRDILSRKERVNVDINNRFILLNNRQYKCVGLYRLQNKRKKYETWQNDTNRRI